MTYTLADLDRVRTCLQADMTAKQIAGVLQLDIETVRAMRDEIRSCDDGKGWPKISPPAAMPTYEPVTASEARQIQRTVPASMPTNVPPPAPTMLSRSPIGSAANACAEAARPRMVLDGYVRST